MKTLFEKFFLRKVKKNKKEREMVIEVGFKVFKNWDAFAIFLKFNTLNKLNQNRYYNRNKLFLEFTIYLLTNNLHLCI